MLIAASAGPGSFPSRKTQARAFVSVDSRGSLSGGLLQVGFIMNCGDWRLIFTQGPSPHFKRSVCTQFLFAAFFFYLSAKAGSSIRLYENTQDPKQNCFSQ